MRVSSGGKLRPQGTVLVTTQTLTTLVTVMTLVTFSLNTALAASQEKPKIDPDTIQIPTFPSTPPPIAQPAPSNPFSCQRTFIYQGKALGCDSNVQQDGEKLRPILENVPTALSELNLYQRNRRKLRETAYITSAGLGVMLAGFLLSRPAFEEKSITRGGFLALGGAAVALGGTAYTLGAAKAGGQNSSETTRTLAYLGAGSLGLFLAGYLTEDGPLITAKPRAGGYLVLGGMGLGLAGFSFGMGIRQSNESHIHNAVSEYNRVRPEKPIELQFNAEFKL